MANNRVCHFEIPGDDPEALTRFYGQLFGWKFHKSPVAAVEYWLCQTGNSGPGIDGAIMKRQHPQHPLTNYVDVADVGVAEHHLVDVVVGDQVLQALLGDDRDPVGIAGAGQGGRVGAVVDVGDLGGGEGDHPGTRVATEGAVEVVEVAAGGPHDEHPSLQARLLASGCRPPRPPACIA